MKKSIIIALGLSFLLLLFISCQHEEQITPANIGEDFSSFTISNLKLQINYPDLKSYDSAYVIFKNSQGEFKEKLTLNNSTHIATRIVPLIPPGDYTLSTSFFSTIQSNYQSLEKNSVVSLRITNTATDVIFTNVVAFVKDASTPVQKSFKWTEFYFYQLFSSAGREGFLRLPKDPTNPFVQIVTFNQKWIYAYVDRSFYNRNLAGTSSFFQGGAAFEIYGTSGSTQDRLQKNIIDTSSLASGISLVLNKQWNFVDGLVILAGANIGDEILVYHEWDLRTSSGGRTKSSEIPSWSKSEIENRKRIHLK